MFGGADTLNTNPERQGISAPVGRLNVMKARAVLEARGLKVLVTDVGGSQGRKIFFYTHTGEVLLKRLSSGIFLSESI
jgi:chemotaxis protein CheD